VTFLPAFSTVVNATVATNGVSTPEGVAGVAIRIGAARTSGSRPMAYPIKSWAGLGGFPPGRFDGNATNLFRSQPGHDECALCEPCRERRALLSGTPIDAQNGITLCLVDNELLAYETVLLTGTNTYKLTTLYRGMYGTAPATHSSGSPFVRVDSSVFQYPLPASFIGITIYVKLQSFNAFGFALEDLSECQVFTYTPTGAGSPAGPVTAALLVGTNLDFGKVSSAVSETDQWGIVSDGIMLATVDLGTVH